jgi:hypothetical protein
MSELNACVRRRFITAKVSLSFCVSYGLNSPLVLKVNSNAAVALDGFRVEILGESSLADLCLMATAGGLFMCLGDEIGKNGRWRRIFQTCKY